MVTKDKALRVRHLRFTSLPIEDGEVRKIPVHHGPPQPVDPNDRCFVAAWALRFEGDVLIGHRSIAENGPLKAGEQPLYAYREICPDWSWFNNQQFVDTLNPQAMRRFIEVTHEVYKEQLGEHFGTTAPAIFTDEPLFRGLEMPANTHFNEDFFISWTDDFADSYQANFNENLLEIFPAILFDTADGSHRRARWRFQNHHTDRFADAFAGQIGAWCGDNGIALTGHMMAEESLSSQTEWVGEVMRDLRHFQLPGIDLLCDKYAPTTAKQAQSIARQCAAPGVLSELYGVTNWDFPFEGHKRQGDWQAALGITQRVHHLTWYQMGGESKRDYPASIGEQSPWWQRYRLVEDHFARVNVALRSGTHIAAWLCCTPSRVSGWFMAPMLAPKNANAWRMDLLTLDWLLDALIDLDLVSESVLADLEAGDDQQGFRVGEMVYDAVVVPPVLALRRNG